MTEAPHTAVFLARVWWEDGQFRARVTYMVDVESDDVDQHRIVTADPAEVRRHLANWLDAAAAAAR
jgi:hypothetical protein